MYVPQQILRRVRSLKFNTKSVKTASYRKLVFQIENLDFGYERIIIPVIKKIITFYLVFCWDKFDIIFSTLVFKFQLMSGLNERSQNYPCMNHGIQPSIQPMLLLSGVNPIYPGKIKNVKKVPYKQVFRFDLI